MAARQAIRLPDWILDALNKDPAFRVVSMDGQSWIDPFTGEMLPAPFGHYDVALRHFSTTKPWTTKEPLPLKDLLYQRWRAYLEQNLSFMPQLSIFRNGLWLNPYSGQWLSGIRNRNQRLTNQSMEDIARALGKCEEAQHGKMLEQHELDALKQLGPPGEQMAEQQTAAYTKLKSASDFAAAKKQFIKMLCKPPRLPGFQIALQYHPHSIIPRNFYDFISLDRDRIMIVLGDLTGDGPGAAMLLTQTIRIMRRLCTMRPDLLDLFANLNDELRADLIHGCSIGLFAAIVNLPFNSLTCLSVGFHPAVLINPHRDIALQQIHTEGERLGVTNGQQFRSSLRPVSIQLQAGDIIAMFTDGIAHAFNERDVNAGRLNAMGSFAGYQELPCGMMITKVVEEAKSRLVHDRPEDLSALVLRVKEPGEESGTGQFTAAATAAKTTVAKPVRRRRS